MVTSGIYVILSGDGLSDRTLTNSPELFTVPQSRFNTIDEIYIIDWLKKQYPHQVYINTNALIIAWMSGGGVIKNQYIPLEIIELIGSFIPLKTKIRFRKRTFILEGVLMERQKQYIEKSLVQRGKVQNIWKPQISSKKQRKERYKRQQFNFKR